MIMASFTLGVVKIPMKDTKDICLDLFLQPTG